MSDRPLRLAATHRGALRSDVANAQSAPLRVAAKRVLIAALACLAAVPASAQTKPEEDPPLPKFAQMEIPSADELLRGKPVDWVILLNNDVLVVELISPRPNALKLLQQQYDDLLKSKPAGMDPAERRRKLHDLQRLLVTLVNGGEEPDYYLETRFIDRIMYFEDLVLKRASLLMDAGQLTAAYELLMFVQRRHPGWPDFDAHYQRFLFLEGARLANAQQPEAALVQFERLFGRNGRYPQLSEQLGNVVDALMTAALEQDDFRRARHFLARLERLEPEHFVVRKRREDLSQRAGSALAAGRSAFANGNYREAVDHADRAARIWPDLAGLKEAHRELTTKYQVVHAGVVNLAGEAATCPSAADDRQRLLCEIPLFEPDRLQDGVVRYRSAFIESWEPRDLGRELQFQLRPRRAPWESRPVLTAGMIADSFVQRRELGWQTGDDRWSANVRAIAADSPWEWRLTLSQIPLRVEGWLRVTVPLTSDAQSWNGDLDPATWQTPQQQRFRLVERTDDRAVYRRTRPEADTVAPRHVAEIREHRYADWDRLLQGLNRGEIDFTPVAEWRDLAMLQQDNRFFVLPYALPRTHVVLVNPRSPAALNGPLRRALLHALPREALLNEQVLQNTNSAWGRVVTSPFATATYAYDVRLDQPEYSAGLATSLAATAKKELGGELPVLKLRAPRDAVVARVLPELLQHWQRAGITVEVLSDDAGPSAAWDLQYATVRLTEPYVDLWLLIAGDGPADWKTLQIFPHWLRHELLELERTVDWTAAVRLLQRIQAEFLEEARWLPLWEVDEFLVARRRITGLVLQGAPKSPMHAYDHVERWTVQSWYPTDVP